MHICLIQSDHQDWLIFFDSSRVTSWEEKSFEAKLGAFCVELPTLGWEITGDLGIQPVEGMAWGRKGPSSRVFVCLFFPGGMHQNCVLEHLYQNRILILKNKIKS